MSKSSHGEWMSSLVRTKANAISGRAARVQGDPRVLAALKADSNDFSQQLDRERQKRDPADRDREREPRRSREEPGGWPERLERRQASLATDRSNSPGNAFKFTREHTEVKLTAYAAGARVLIDVSDHCGGLPAGQVNKIFIPFFQQTSDKTGVGLGLSMARRAIEADGGELTVRDSPGVDCVFTISLPRHTLQ